MPQVLQMGRPRKTRAKEKRRTSERRRSKSENARSRSRSRSGSRSRGRSRSRSRSRSGSRSRGRSRSRSRSQGRNKRRRAKKSTLTHWDEIMRLNPHSMPHPTNVASLNFIHPNLFLTCLEGAQRFQNDVAIVATGTSFTTRYLSKHPAVYRAFVTAQDTAGMTRSEFNAIFDKGADLLKKALSYQKPTFLHCRMGINRSVALALAYVKKHTKLDFDRVLEQIREVNMLHRGVPALVNPAFAEHIQYF